MFLFATIVYYLTLEPTMPFWDCGEFIASAYKLEVGHPPGAPLFMLIARLFSAFVEPAKVPFMINMLSAISSGATIMFLHWSITHLAKKLADLNGEWSQGKMIAVIGSGLVGALAYTFSDSFWFSAVEGEVYAMSSLFTAVVFWAILKWESVVDERGSLRWIILIAYLMGLSIGVHLLNLLAIPAIAFVYYFKRYEFSWKGVIITGAVALGLLGLIQTGIIIYAVKLAGSFEKMFVNGFGLPFNSGVIFYLIILVALIVFGIYYTTKKGWVAANTLIVGIAVAIIGYTSFGTIVVRSQANTPMDENNPENIFALLSYLNREQYGDRPLLYGQYFNTPEDKLDPYLDGPPSWVKSFSVREDNSVNRLVISCRERFEAEKFISEHTDRKLKIVEEYIDSGEKKESVVNYMKEYCGFFPRMYSSQANHISEYKNWSNYKNWNSVAGRQKVTDDERYIAQLEYQLRGAKTRPEFNSYMRALEKKYGEMMPSTGEDLTYLFSYQVNWMYWRYFMWNFAGKQDDSQGMGDFLDGNWISGFDVVDEDRLGNRDALPEMELNNKGMNKFFFIPLILGLIGLIFQLIRNPKDFAVVGLLFFLTGLAIVIYLNQTPLQPRERDYAYAGSFYAFAVWIGLGVYALFYAAQNMTWKSLGTLAAMSIGGSIVLYGLESAVSSDDKGFSMSLLIISVISVAFFAVSTLLHQLKTSDLIKGVVALVIGLSAPYLMAKDGWDDHNRAHRETGIAMASNYLNSLAPNAIIFTNGDNDTFPLWYAQEVEGIRTDVRVVNLSLLNTDWYIDQMKRRAYESDPVPFKIPEQKYRQGTRDVLFLDPYDKTTGFMSVDDALKFTLNDQNVIENGDRALHYLPSYLFSLPVSDEAKAMYEPFLHEGDSLVSEIKWGIVDTRGNPRSYITKANLMVLDLINNMDWKRPVYFAVTTGGESYMGLERYFQLEGLAYRLTPILHKNSANPNLDGGVATDLMYENMMKNFKWGNMDTEDIYLDENNRRMTSNLRLQFSHLAEQLISEGRLEEAIEALDKCQSSMPEKNVPYDQPQIMWNISQLYYDAGAPEKGLELAKRMFEINQQEIDYFNSLDEGRQGAMARDIELRARLNSIMVGQAEEFFPDDADVKKMREESDQVMEDFGMEVETRVPVTNDKNGPQVMEFDDDMMPIEK
ncbi:MAG: DUF2723 domain-containing protein [Flavobacteriales bacterium]